MQPRVTLKMARLHRKKSPDGEGTPPGQRSEAEMLNRRGTPSDPLPQKF